MKIVVFGLTISSSWGNGHATLWRGISRALARLGHRVVFFEKDVPYYAASRDLLEIPNGELVLFEAWEQVRSRAATEIADADVAMMTSYCPDGVKVADLLLNAHRAKRVFYDLDTPVTLSRFRIGETTTYIGPRMLADFDLVLSYTGGDALEKLRSELGARRVSPLYGHVDPEVHRPVCPVAHFLSDLSYLGTYAADRQHALERLFVEPALCRSNQRFLIGGAQYPEDFPWAPNIFFARHLPPPEHPAFFSSSRLTLNVTRQAMAEMGWCPPGRLFEAAACGVPVLSDCWPGLGDFFEPGREIIVVHTTDDVQDALDLSDLELKRIGAAARERTLAEHSSGRRAEELVSLLASTGSPANSAAMMEA
jgi:spore maturation protein CgeB